MPEGPGQGSSNVKPVADMDMVELWSWLTNHDRLNGVGDHGDGYYAIDHLDVDFVHVYGGMKKDEVVYVPECWLELGPMYDQREDAQIPEDTRAAYPFVPTHDPDLDSGGSTFEIAFRNLCNLVLMHYGDYEGDLR